MTTLTDSNDNVVLPRRGLLGASVAAVASAAVLAACGDQNDGSDGPSASTAPAQPAPADLEPKKLTAVDQANVAYLQTAYGIQLAATGIYTVLKDTKVRPDGSVVLGSDPNVATSEGFTDASTTTTTLPTGTKDLFSPTLGSGTSAPTDPLASLVKAAVDRGASIHTTHSTFLSGYVARFRVTPNATANAAIVASAQSFLTRLSTGKFATDNARLAIAYQGAALLADIEAIITASYLQLNQQVQLGGTEDVDIPAAGQFRVAFGSCGSVSARLTTYMRSLLGSLELNRVFADADGSVV